MRYVQVAGERQSTVSFVFKFASFDFPLRHRQIRVLTFQGLNASHFIHTFRAVSLFRPFRSLLVKLVDRFHFVIKVGFVGGRQPIPI